MAEAFRLSLYCARVRGGRVAIVVVGALALAGCSSETTNQAAKSSSTVVTTSTIAPTTTAPSTTGAPSTSNLVVTDATRAALETAGAALNSLPASAYTGLRPGETYYAYDSATGTYWAGAGLIPSPSSTPAQVSTQDDGAYLLFDRPQGGPWKAYAVGLAGTADGTACPVMVPDPILALWGWPAGSCRPATIS
jgi:hypothetical protein